jgi:tRNA pseudouridine65 synthase
MKLKIIAQEKNWIAVHKPSGLVTYSDGGESGKGAKEFLESQIKRKLFPVHRIDKDTDGLLVFASSDATARELTALFRSRTVKKAYLAVVHGQPPEKGVIDEPLEKNKSKEKEPAITEFTRLATAEVEWDGEKRAYSLVRCEMKTGRFHQIRRHMRAVGHPLCGDPEYGNGWDNRAFKERFKIERTLLSAVSVAFPDRAAQKMVRLKTQPDPDFMKVLQLFGWKL